MSVLLSTLISDANQELNLVGQRIANSDYLLFADRTRKYFYTSYKIPTTQRSSDLLLYPGVKEYPLPSDFIGAMELERPYALGSPNFNHTTERELTHWLHGNSTAFKFDRENQFMIVNYTGGSQINLATCQSLTDGETWTIYGDGSALGIDSQYFTTGNSSIRFTVTASSGTTTLRCVLSNPIDFTDLLGKDNHFLDLFCPQSNSVAVAGVTLSLGSSPSNYYTFTTATTRFRGDTILGGFGQVGFDGTTYTTTGTPDVTQVDYISIAINHGLTGVNGVYRLDNIFSSLGDYFQLPYYSKYNVKDGSGAYKERVTATDDTILCPSDFDELFTYKVAEMGASLRLRDAEMANYFRQELIPKENYLKSKYPRQENRTQSTYYKRANSF